MQTLDGGIPQRQSTLDLAIVRQHTPVQISIDSDAELLCVEVIGDHSIVLLGFTRSGAEMFVRQIQDGIDRLDVAQADLADETSVRC
ncbi:MAG TPA: hypothetical protein VFX16_07725 [Pseudonocardiaceae bacterium]|nr:hypothetical protein [Pseudonocardiaceae bacterium]